MTDNADDTAPPRTDAIERATDIVAAYVSNNAVRVSELASLIADVHAALTRLANPTSVETATSEKATPAQVKKSITPDALVSFEDGKSYKTLRRHLTKYNLSPEAYREKWGLPRDYPMTAPAYSAQRSQMAMSFGLGQQSKGRPKGKRGKTDASL